ncbi:helix-turn-helix transcriptional regulator [Rhodomicrobium sp.]|uniref:helix-turn-helix transcriptional regulator n=1 Tax=Rhodomicrobium sp. TaxID=2720632 RepID=UPI0039E26773
METTCSHVCCVNQQFTAGIIVNDSIERIDAVMARTSMRRTTVYAKIKEGCFPPGFTRGRARCWLRSDIDRLLAIWAAGGEWTASDQEAA